MINTPQTLHKPIHPIPRQITSPINPPLTKRTLHKPLSRQIRPPPIPPRQPIPTNPQLPNLTNPNRLHPIIQDEQRRIRDRPPNRNRLPNRINPTTRRPNRRLRRPIHIPQLNPNTNQPIRQHQRQPLTTTQPPQTPSRRHPTRIHQHPPRRRRRLHHRRTTRLQQPRQQPRIRPHPILSNHNPPTNQQRQPQLQTRNIKRQRRNRHQHIIHTQPRTLPHRPQKIHQRPMRNLHTLRQPRRPRRINHIRQPLRITHHLRSHPRTPLNQTPIPIQTHNLNPINRQPRNQPLLRHHHRRPRRLQHKRLPLNRITRINRHIRPTSPQHPQQPHQHPNRPLHTNPHQHPRPNPQPNQKIRQPSRPHIQLTKRQRLRTTNNPNPISRPLKHPHQQLMQTHRRKHRPRLIPTHQHPLTLNPRQHGGLVGVGAGRVRARRSAHHPTASVATRAHGCARRVRPRRRSCCWSVLTCPAAPD
jgi:hypothetical protein